MAYIAQISFSKNSLVIAAQISVTFRTQDLRKAVPLVREPHRHATNVEQDLIGDRQCSRTGSRALNAKNAETQWRCGSSSLKDPVSIRGLSNARNALSPKPWWYRSPAKWMSLSRHLWHQRQYRRLDRHDGFALLFEHVPTRIDTGDALIVMALMKSTGRRAACPIVAAVRRRSCGVKVASSLSNTTRRTAWLGE